MRTRPVVVSLFDGLGGARLACALVGIHPDYFRAEIEDAPSLVHHHNWDDRGLGATVDLGDVTEIDYSTVPQRPDLLIGGSPCQDLSSGRILGRGGRQSLEGVKSRLFWEYVRALVELRPRAFVFENVGTMSSDAYQTITDTFGVEAHVIDASVFTGQARRRFFWTNLRVPLLPKFPRATLRDQLDRHPAKDLNLSQKAIDYLFRPSGKSQRTPWARHGTDVATRRFSRTLVANLARGVPYNALKDGRGVYRRFSVAEVERLFGVPVGYTDVPGVTINQRYRMLGNGYVVPVIAHLLTNYHSSGAVSGS